MFYRFTCHIQTLSGAKHEIQIQLPCVCHVNCSRLSETVYLKLCTCRPLKIQDYALNNIWGACNAFIISYTIKSNFNTKFTMHIEEKTDEYWGKKILKNAEWRNEMRKWKWKRKRDMAFALKRNHTEVQLK